MKRRDFIAALAASPAIAGATNDQDRPSSAQTTSTKPLTITLLGTGTPAPSLTRQSSGYVIEVGGVPGCLRQSPRQCHHREAGRREGAGAHASARQIDLPGIREQIVHEIQEVFEGKVVWGEDLMRLGLSGSRVAHIETRQG